MKDLSLLGQIRKGDALKKASEKFNGYASTPILEGQIFIRRAGTR